MAFSGSVALYTSAWIEISAYAWKLSKLPVALYTSAWIEIDYIKSALDGYASRTLHECVD